jgi:hypothetical protein
MDEFQPMSHDFTAPLVERALLLVTNATRTPVTLRIGVPVQDVETVDDWDWRLLPGRGFGSRTRFRLRQRGSQNATSTSAG